LNETDRQADKSGAAGKEILNSLLHYGLEKESQRRELEEHLAQYMQHKELLYHVSSDSDDDWSEPNRDASKARIGLEGDLLVNHNKSISRTLPRKKSNRRRSSVGEQRTLITIAFHLFD